MAAAPCPLRAGAGAAATVVGAPTAAAAAAAAAVGLAPTAAVGGQDTTMAGPTAKIVHHRGGRQLVAPMLLDAGS